MSDTGPQQEKIILKMDQDDQRNSRGALEIYLPKRRPGRPRKQPRTNADREENVVPRVQNLQRQENAPVLPGFAGFNASQPRQANANDIAVGQQVHGVIDSTFNGGYLLTVRVGISDNTLRGVVFKSGQDVPVAVDNGSMIRRNAMVPIPADRLNKVQVHNSQARKRNEKHVNSYRTPIPKLPISRAKQPPLVGRAPRLPILKIRQHPPVLILPKNNVLNVVPPLPVEASKGKHTDQVSTVGDQVLPSPPTSNREMPSENLPTHEDPSPSEKTQMITIKKEDNVIDDQYSILVEPLQTMLPDLNNPASPLECSGDF